MEDKTKVKSKIDELNKTYNTTNAWTAIDGYYAITKFDFGKDDKNPNFSPSSGVPVKMFVNQTNGEIKLFLAKLFEK